MGIRNLQEVSEPYPGWHCVWIDEIAGQWVVSCIPHGTVARRATHLSAFEAAVEHDPNNERGWYAESE